jgi:2-polyprenyl-3-methyl-5-hydroxy-6-metoxy-1,4-benzoquinol methylase
MKKNKCHICNQFCSKSKKTLNLPNLKFISSTGKLVGVSKKYSFCQNSYFINTINNQVWKKNIKKIYSNYNFNEKGIPKHSSTREKIIYEKIKNLNLKINKVLEIGPGNGQLIKKLNKIKRINTIDAYDINKKNLNIFRKIKKFNNFYLELQKIDSKYDLIILSHSIFHITRLHESFDTISKLLKKDSHILIITPDPYEYPILPYVFEISWFSSSENIVNYLNRFNLYLKFNFKKLLKNEIVILITNKKKIRLKKDKNFLKKFIDLQKKFKNKINSLKKEKSLIIHGAGINGLFLYYNLKKNIFKIYDDNFKVKIKNNNKLLYKKIKKIESFHLNKIIN